jgi:hypothetical protein
MHTSALCDNPYMGHGQNQRFSAFLLLPGATKSPPGLGKYSYLSFFPPVPFSKKVRHVFFFFISFLGFFYLFFWLLPSQLPPFQAIPLRPKPTSSISSYLSQVKTNFLRSKSFQLDQNRLLPLLTIPLRPKTTLYISRHSSQAKIDFLHFNPFQSGQYRAPLFHAILAKTDLLHSKPFQSGQNRLLPFPAITVRPKVHWQWSCGTMLVS